MYESVEFKLSTVQCRLMIWMTQWTRQHFQSESLYRASWKRKFVSLRSPVATVSLRPISPSQTPEASSAQGPNVSTATGMKMWDWSNARYFWVLESSGVVCSRASQTSCELQVLVQREVLLVLESSGVVCSRASQTSCGLASGKLPRCLGLSHPPKPDNSFPLAHGMRDTPSGLRADPTTQSQVGSLIPMLDPRTPQEILHRDVVEPRVFLILTSCALFARESMGPSCVHLWTRMDKSGGHTMQIPGRSPTATLMISSDIRRPPRLSEEGHSASHSRVELLRGQ